jgi:hypothetical protein
MAVALEVSERQEPERAERASRRQNVGGERADAIRDDVPTPSVSLGCPKATHPQDRGR